MSVAETPVSSSAPSRSREATRQRLVEAGTRLFAESGLHGVTSARIAEAAGVATGTFYLHFKDKEVLFREIVFTALADLERRQEWAAQGLAPGTPESMRARTDELLAFAADNRELIRVAFRRGGESANVGEAVLDHIVPGIERSYRALLGDGEIPETIHPGVAAQARAATLTRVIAWWAEDPTRASRDEVVETLLTLHPARPGA